MTELNLEPTQRPGVDPVRINPTTFAIEGLPEGTMSARQFDELELPACPACGTEVHVDRVDVTTMGDLPIRRYLAGIWECPRGCDPRAA